MQPIPSARIESLSPFRPEMAFRSYRSSLFLTAFSFFHCLSVSPFLRIRILKHVFPLSVNRTRYVAYRCEIVSEISCARPLAAFVSPSWLSGRPRPKIHVFRISLSVLRICSFFYPANPKIVAPKSTVSGQCASKFRGGNTRFSFGFSLFPPSNFDLPSFRSFLVCLSRASFNFLFSSSK